MEMNTRLQVEHPVTEMITGQDLVEWQLRVAAGEHLPCRQEELTINGWAMEARIYAEDPANDFLPATGRLSWLRFPQPGSNVRIDSGVTTGDDISVYYDPMLAKLIVHDRDRDACLQQLTRALQATEIVGPASNLRFLRAVAGHPAFQTGGVDTGFIDCYRADLSGLPSAVDYTTLALASLYVLLERRAARRAHAASSGDRYSPWRHDCPWRLNIDVREDLHFVCGSRILDVSVRHTVAGFVLEFDGACLRVSGELAKQRLFATIDGHRLSVTVIDDDDHLTILRDGESLTLTHLDERLHELTHDDTPATLSAPMPGTVIAVKVKDGERVSKDAPLIVIEAMKMEHTIKAPHDGVVTALPYKAGDMIEEGVELARVEPAS
jgi:3-methylcrotonyl-CoA carboxylase alpha subunit